MKNQYEVRLERNHDGNGHYALFVNDLYWAIYSTARDAQAEAERLQAEDDEAEYHKLTASLQNAALTLDCSQPGGMEQLMEFRSRLEQKEVLRQKLGLPEAE